MVGYFIAAVCSKPQFQRDYQFAMHTSDCLSMLSITLTIRSGVGWRKSIGGADERASGHGRCEAILEFGCCRRPVHTQGDLTRPE